MFSKSRLAWCLAASLVAAPCAGNKQREGELPRVAVCLTGELRGGDEVLQSIVGHVLQPLAADVFVYMPLIRRQQSKDGSGGGPPLSPSADELAKLQALPGLMALHLEVENGTALLKAEVRRRQPSEKAANATYALALQVAGGWLGGVEEPAPPGLASVEGGWWTRPGSGLYQQLSKRRCLEMVRRAEDVAGGRRYDWIVTSRLDLRWERDHLPLELLTPDAIWIPEGEDWGGLNDRHAIIPRAAAPDQVEKAEGLPTMVEIYMDSWGFIGKGTAGALAHMVLQDEAKKGALPAVEATGCDPDYDGPGPHLRQPCFNPESFLWLRIQATGASIKRLPAFAWIWCASDRARSWRREDPNLQGCSAAGTKYKYESEYSLARRQAECFGKMLHFEVSTTSRRATLEQTHAAVRACWCGGGKVGDVAAQRSGTTAASSATRMCDYSGSPAERMVCLSRSLSLCD
eukprot:TRINITY_DN74252_c0_g1_i1.p1 TRINITY_DN74252_c0_g1~~TRINITY_DN74252_c0_g1_i1.p1  ORF type:complete len:460 (+),score=82.09 TRINITY_DN74252_c0_g1_i1:226-1605(+)